MTLSFVIIVMHHTLVKKRKPIQNGVLFHVADYDLKRE